MKSTVIAIAGAFLIFCGFKVLGDPQSTLLHWAAFTVIALLFIWIVTWECREEPLIYKDGIAAKECWRHGKAGGYQAVLGPAGRYRCPKCGLVWKKDCWL